MDNLELSFLETERIKLRLLSMDDAQWVFAHFSDIEVTRFMDIDPCKSIIEAEEIIRFHIEDEGCRWGLFDRNNGAFIGTAGFHYIRKASDGVTAEVGFNLTYRLWGKGLMYEAMKEIIQYGFTHMGFTAIDATVDPKNTRSVQLMSKLGFKRDEALKDQLLYFYLHREAE